MASWMSAGLTLPEEPTKGNVEFEEDVVSRLQGLHREPLTMRSNVRSVPPKWHLTVAATKHLP